MNKVIFVKKKNYYYYYYYYYYYKLLSVFADTYIIIIRVCIDS